MAFRSNDAILPPWRMASSMLSKWQPRKSMDIPIAPGPHPVSSHGEWANGDKDKGRPSALSLDSKSGVGHKRSSDSMGNSRQLKPQAFEPSRIYGGFGTMSMITG
jgi:hypothetical protein